MTAYRKGRLFITTLSCLLALLLSLSVASVNASYAPVVNAWQDPAAMKSRYRVQKDDTIYSIAWAFDLDYRDLAKANHLRPPYPLKPGQTLTMQVTSDASHEKEKSPEDLQTVTTFALKEVNAQKNSAYQELETKPHKVTSFSQKTLNNTQAEIPEPKSTQQALLLPEIVLKPHANKVPDKKQPPLPQHEENIIEMPEKTVVSNQDKIIGRVRSMRWLWPATGRVLKEFSLETGGNKGIDIAGTLNDPVRAIAPGKVVYSGSGLRGYGNLVIIKHSDNYLSAYAYNRRLLVKEGDVVKAGAEIGKMGQNNSGDVLLHFEIRRNGKPVNPLLYL